MTNNESSKSSSQKVNNRPKIQYIHDIWYGNLAELATLDCSTSVQRQNGQVLKKDYTKYISICFYSIFIWLLISTVNSSLIVVKIVFQGSKNIFVTQILGFVYNFSYCDISFALDYNTKFYTQQIFQCESCTMF